jgi:ribosomal subunit interface protein
MIKNLQISGIHNDLTDEVEQYVRKKIGPLDRYIPKKLRKSTHADVKLKQASTKKKLNCTCEVIVHLPKETIIITETETTMLAAIDVAEDKLKVRLKKYKDKHSVNSLQKRVIRRFVRRQR